MAYNPALYQPYGQMYGNYSQMGQPQYQTQSQQPQQQPIGMIWVDGEVGAKAYQLPAGWPVNTPLPLWDTNDTVIYLKSTNQMGIPNPIQKARYQMEGQQTQNQSGQTKMLGSGDSEPVEAPRGMEAFATKGDLEKVRQEIVQAIQEGQQSQPTAKKGTKSNEPTV